MNDRPSIKKVVNVGKMRFQTKSNNFAAQTNGNITDLHRLNSIKSISYYDTINKAPDTAQLTSYTLNQTSELDLDEKFSLEKINPIFSQNQDEIIADKMPLKPNDNAKVLKIECEFKPITKPADEMTRKGDTPLIKPNYNSSASFSSNKSNFSSSSILNDRASLLGKNSEKNSFSEAKSIHSNGSVKSMLGAFSRLEEENLSHDPKIKILEGSIKSNDRSTPKEESKLTLNLDNNNQDRLSSIAKSIGFSNGSFRSFDDITLQEDSSSLASFSNQNEFEKNVRNIFPLVAVSEADVFEFNENKSDEDDDDMLSLYNTELDFFNQNLHSLNIRERKTSDISKEVCFKFINNL